MIYSRWFAAPINENIFHAWPKFVTREIRGLQQRLQHLTNFQWFFKTCIYQKKIFNSKSQTPYVIFTDKIFHLLSRHVQVCQVHESSKLIKFHKQ